MGGQRLRNRCALRANASLSSCKQGQLAKPPPAGHRGAHAVRATNGRVRPELPDSDPCDRPQTENRRPKSRNRCSLLQNDRYRRRGAWGTASMTSLTFSLGGCTAMMGIKERVFSPLPRDVSLEDLVPKGNFYRRLEAASNLSFVRELARDLYARGGRPSVDPVVFFKLQLVMFFEGLRSERELMRIAADRLSVRWYLGYDLHEALPDHSNLTRTRERFGLSVFRRFFERIVEECVEAGLVRGDELFFDSTKVEGNAAVGSLAPRWAVEAHLGELFDEGQAGHDPGAHPEARLAI